MLSITKEHLKQFDNPHDFERLCADILNSLGYKDVDLVAPGGGSDGGADIKYSTVDGGKGLACVTLRKDINRKIREDLQKRKKGEYEEYIYFTNQKITAAQKLKYTKYCADALGAMFVPRDIEAMRSLLDSALQKLRNHYFGISETPSFTIEISKVELFSIGHMPEDATQVHDKFKLKIEEKSYMAGRFPASMSFPHLGIFSPEDELSHRKDYVNDLKTFREKIKKIIGFDMTIISNSADQDIEVVVRAPINGLMMMGDDILELPKMEGGIGVTFPASLYRSQQPHDHQFHTLIAEDNLTLHSRVKTINAGRVKGLFDEAVYVMMEEETSKVELIVTVYSNKSNEPTVAKLYLDTAEAEIVDISVPIID